MKTNKILIILGPTATGKTKLAVKLAEKFNGEIISADSRQIYKGMNIGSGKDLKEYKKIKYHLIDIVPPNTNFNVAKFQKLAYAAIDDIIKRKKIPILAGGTGLYISAIVDGLNFPQQNDLKQTRNKLNKLSLKQLLARLKKIDPKTYKACDQKNRRRVQRALEIYYQTGKPKSKQKKSKPRYNCLQIGINFPKEIIHKKIEKRLEQRLKGGAMVREVKNLHYKKNVSWKRLESFGLEYKWVSLYLQDKINYKEMKKNLARNIKQFAKRQITWFKRDNKIIWENDFKKIKTLTSNFF
jgi:tRNA dimethylallyltransferase